MSKPDVALLNKLVKSLNDQLTLATKIKEVSSESAHEYIEEIAKCMGLATTLATEASALSFDFLNEIKVNSAGKIKSMFAHTDLGSITSIDELFDNASGSKKKN